MFPEPHDDEVVSFLDFHRRGLGLPVHKLFYGFLHTLSLDHQHLSPNVVLQLAVFVTLCQGFLGIEPHTALFLRLFEVRGQPLSQMMPGYMPGCHPAVDTKIHR